MRLDTHQGLQWAYSSSIIVLDKASWYVNSQWGTTLKEQSYVFFSMQRYDFAIRLGNSQNCLFISHRLFVFNLKSELLTMHIAVTGNIGAGKTTLASLLADHFGWEVFFEAVEGNPYLADFYADMDRWSFNLQIYFLKSRFEQVMRIMDSTKRIVQDRTIYEDAHIFAKNLFQSGYMSQRDYESYLALFELMMSVVKPPDLMIYLRADLPKLVSQIKKRGRDFESNMSEQYLADLNVHYEDFVNNYKEGKVLVLDVNNLDYANRKEDLQSVIDAVDRALLYG